MLGGQLVTQRVHPDNLLPSRTARPTAGASDGQSVVASRVADQAPSARGAFLAGALLGRCLLGHGLLGRRLLGRRLLGRGLLRWRLLARGAFLAAAFLAGAFLAAVLAGLLGRRPSSPAPSWREPSSRGGLLGRGLLRRGLLGRSLLRGAAIRLLPFLFGLSAVLRVELGVNFIAVEAAIFTGAPVCGLRPVRAARLVVLNEPKPGHATLSPFLVAVDHVVEERTDRPLGVRLGHAAEVATASMSSALVAWILFRDGRSRATSLGVCHRGCRAVPVALELRQIEPGTAPITQASISCICNDAYEALSDCRTESGLLERARAAPRLRASPARTRDAARRTRAARRPWCAARRARGGGRRSGSRRCCWRRTCPARRARSASRPRSAGRARRTARPSSRSGSVTTCADGHDEHVPGEQRRPIEEGDGDVVAAHHLGLVVAGDDGAEHAGHESRAGHSRRPHAALILPRARDHPPPCAVACDTTGRRWLPRAHLRSLRSDPQGVAVTDLLPAASTATEASERRAAGDAHEGRARHVRAHRRPACVTSFDDVDVVIPLTVVEELDGLKTRPDDVGRAARTALRTIEELRVRHGGSLAEPVPVGATAACRSRSTASRSTSSSSTGSTRRARTTASSAPPSARPSAARRRWCPTTPRCGSRPPTSASPPPSTSRPGAHRPTQPTGWSTIETDPRGHRLPVRRGRRSTPTAVDGPPTVGENEFAVLRAGSQSALTRRVGDELRAARRTPCAGGVGPAAALEGAALRPRAAARPGDRGRRPRRAGRHGQDAARRRRRARAGRRAQPLRAPRRLPPARARSGRADVGFLPGGLDEKLDPWMSAIHDAIVALTDHAVERRRPPPDRRADRTRPAVARVGDVPARPLAAAPDGRHRRGPEPRADDAADDPHPRRRGHQGRVHRRHQPDRRARTSASRTTPSPCSPRRSAASPASATSRSPPASAATSPASPPSCCRPPSPSGGSSECLSGSAHGHSMPPDTRMA